MLKGKSYAYKLAFTAIVLVVMIVTTTVYGSVGIKVTSHKAIIPI